MRRRKEVKWVKRNMAEYIRFLEDEIAKKDSIIEELNKEKNSLMEEIDLLRMRVNNSRRRFILN